MFDILASLLVKLVVGIEITEFCNK